MKIQTVQMLTTSTLGASTSLVAPTIVEAITSNPTQLSQVITQLVIAIVTIVQLFKNKRNEKVQKLS